MEVLLSGSKASDEFKSDVQGFLSDGRSARVKVKTYVPAVKVRRLLTQLLSAEPSLEIEEVVIRGYSGCSDFVGSVDVQTTSGLHVFEFAWDCRWKAQAEGYVDYFGFPDQMRAALEFDWRCFRRWERAATN